MDKQSRTISLTIKAKLLLVTILSVAVLIGLSVFSLTQSRQLAQLQNTGHGRAEDARIATNARHGLNALYSIAADMIINGYSADLQTRFETTEALVGDELAQISAKVDTAVETDLITEAVTFHGQFGKIVKTDMIPGLKDGTLDQAAIREIDGELDTAKNAYQDLLVKLADSFQAESIEADEEYDTVNRQGMQISAAVSATVSLILLVLMLLILRSILQPLKALTGFIDRQAGLDFRGSREGKGSGLFARTDEIGRMSKALAAMEESVGQFIVRTSDAAEQVAASSEQLTATAQQTATSTEEVSKTIESIAGGATDQAKDTEQAASGMMALEALLAEEARCVRDLNLSAEEIEHRKDEGYGILKTLIQKTAQGSEAASAIRVIIAGNNESASRIQSASAMIENIASQTNLLALNAAIEAARAGEAGRGFAVVAEEIRKLAEQSNSFTSEIKKVIDELIRRSQNAVTGIADVISVVEAQTESVRQTEERFGAIAVSVDKVKVAVRNLTVSSSAMEAKKNAVLDLMNNLSAVAEENAAATQQASASIEEQSASIEEIAASSESLAQVSVELRQLLQKFSV